MRGWHADGTGQWVDLELSDPDEHGGQGSFEERLAAARNRHAPKPTPHATAAGAFALGTRYAIEIAVTTIVGAGLGLMIDRWLGSGPWGFLALLLLGLAAGIRNLVKAVSAEVPGAARQGPADGVNRKGQE